ncbi:MAG: SDR family oxidoreductase [Actinobacteria bacterium]|nr:SDR family oxidoreductase [Actinomycetota bacterium]
MAGGRLEGRVAVVTAAGSGMGRAGAIRFAAEGAHVWVTDLDGTAAEETVAAIAAAGGSATARQVDVTDVDALRALFAEVDREHGVLHVLWNHAGIPGPAGLAGTEEEWQLTIDVNAKSAYFGTALAEDLLERAAGKASVLFTSSVSGLVASPSGPAYALAKGGIVLLMKSLAVSLGPKGIRCNAICPAAVETPMLRDFFRGVPAEQHEEFKQSFVAATVPLGRLFSPEEVASVALFLACDDSSAVTGVALPVDGGYTAK